MRLVQPVLGFPMTPYCFEGARIELCVEAEHVTEAIEAVRNEVPALKTYPGRIFSVIRGCK